MNSRERTLENKCDGEGALLGLSSSLSNRYRSMRQTKRELDFSHSLTITHTKTDQFDVDLLVYYRIDLPSKFASLFSMMLVNLAQILP